MPMLNELTLSELTVLHHRIGALCEAGRPLESANLGPVFDLTPGAPIAIYTKAVMPGVADHGQPVQFSMEVTGLDDGDEAEGGRTIAEWLSVFDCTFAEMQAGFHMMQTRVEDALKMLEEALQPPQLIISGEVPDMADWIHSRTARIAESGDAVEIDKIPSFLKRESTEAPPTSPASEPVDPPPALGEVVGGGAPAVEQPGPPAGAEISAEPSRPAEADDVPQDAAETGAEAESGGGVEVAAPEVPAAPVPGSASAMASTWQAPMWSAEDDERAISLVVDGIIDNNLSRNQAMISASRAIGRTEEAMKFRCKTKLKARIDDALTSAAMRQAQTEAPEIPPAEVAVASPAAVQPASAEPDPAPEQAAPPAEGLHGEDLRVWEWIAAHRAKWPHTAGTDLDLAVGLGRGEKLNLIALALGIDVPKLQVRWDCLSRPIRNGQDKITLDGMPRLIKILRLIAKAPAAAA